MSFAINSHAPLPDRRLPQPLNSKLLKGTAEIFGTELAIGMSYDFTGRKVAVFSWHGCTLEISFPKLFYIFNVSSECNASNHHSRYRIFLQSLRIFLNSCAACLPLLPFHVQGKCSVEYVANETPMTSYLNTHLAIEGLRQDAQGREEQGPRVSTQLFTSLNRTSQDLDCFSRRL